MQDKIIAAIAAYLEKETHLSSKHGETFVQFMHPIKTGFNRAEYCQEIASEIAAAIAPLVDGVEPDWKDAPEWAEWHVTTEFMGEVKNTWYENLQVDARTRQVGTKSDVRRHLNWGHVIGTIYRRPK